MKAVVSSLDLATAIEWSDFFFGNTHPPLSKFNSHSSDLVGWAFRQSNLLKGEDQSMYTEENWLSRNWLGF